MPQIDDRPTDERDAELEVFDAFAVEDSIIGDVRDPYPRIHRQREEGRVQRLSPTWQMGMIDDDAPVFLVNGGPEVEAVLKDAATYSSKILNDTMGPVMGHTILGMDEPEHLRMRSLVAQAFRIRALTRWESELISPLVDELIDGFAAQGRADLVREFTIQFPMKVIARILGLPRKDWADFMRLSLELISITVNWDRAIGASRTLRNYFTDILEARRAQPQDDLISELAQAEVDGHTLTDDEILPFLNLLLPAGAETTLRSLGNLLLALLSEPSRWDRIRADRNQLHDAIEEALRWEAPVQQTAREIMVDGVVIGDVPVAKGEMVNVSMGAANRDETKYDDPDRFDIHRDGPPHLAFGGGAHYCLGAHLGRLETTVALNAMLDRLEDLRLEPGDKDPHVHGSAFRSPTSLPVRFKPGR